MKHIPNGITIFGLILRLLYPWWTRGHAAR